jgi:UV DNA damage repair endonuclease
VYIYYIRTVNVKKTIRTYLVHHVFCLQTHIFKFLVHISNPIYSFYIHGDHNIVQTMMICPELSQIIRFVMQLSAKNQKEIIHQSKLMVNVSNRHQPKSTLIKKCHYQSQRHNIECRRIPFPAHNTNLIKP